MSWFQKTQLAKTIKVLRNGEHCETAPNQLSKTIKTFKDCKGK